MRPSSRGRTIFIVSITLTERAACVKLASRTVLGRAIQPTYEAGENERKSGALRLAPPGNYINEWARSVRDLAIADHGVKASTCGGRRKSCVVVKRSIATIGDRVGCNCAINRAITANEPLARMFAARPRFLLLELGQLPAAEQPSETMVARSCWRNGHRNTYFLRSYWR